MKNLSRLILLSLLLTHSAYAEIWPSFSPPNIDLLKQLNYIDTKQCPDNQGKILDKSEINIKQHLCKGGNCPSDWTWKTESDGLCHNLKDFFLQKIIIHYHNNAAKGLANYSVIEAFYGFVEDAKTKDETWVKYTISTAPNENWFCIVVNMENEVLGCENDIYRRKIFTPDIDRH